MVQGRIGIDGALQPTDSPASYLGQVIRSRYLVKAIHMAAKGPVKTDNKKTVKGKVLKPGQKAKSSKSNIAPGKTAKGKKAATSVKAIHMAAPESVKAAAVVTSAALAQHNQHNDLKAKLATLFLKGDLSEKDVDTFMAKLNEKETQSLWKKFEMERQSLGPEAVLRYKEATGTVGKNLKKNSALRAFLKDKGKLAEHYTSVIVTVAMARKHGASFEWKSLAEMQEKHGSDLPKLVRSGGVLVRKHPRCPDVLQFKDEVEFGSTVVHRNKNFEAKSGSEVKREDVLKFFKAVGNDEFDEGTFGDELMEPSDEEAEDTQSLALKLFDKKGQKKGGKGSDKEDPTLAALETASQLVSGEGADKGAEKCSTMHGLLAKTSMDIVLAKGALPKNQLWDKSITKMHVDAVAALAKHKKLCEECVGGKKLAVPALKSLLLASAEAVKLGNKCAKSLAMIMA